MSGRILVAEDDAILREFIARGLREQGFAVREARSLDETLACARERPFDIWVLDRKMPDGDMIGALRILRTEGATTPALFLSASGSTQQRIEGLDAGADDYLAKPFSIAELLARVRAIMRRPANLSPAVVRCEALELRLDARRVLVNDRDIAVSANEWRLLALLARRPEMVFSRAQIMAEVGVADDAGEAAVDHLVSRLRQKLADSGAPNLVRTVRGLGFAWNGPG